MSKLFSSAALPRMLGEAAATPAAPLRVAFHDLALDALVGVYAHEKMARQPIRIGVTLDLLCPGPTADDARGWAGALALAGHVTLIETLAERIAARCLADARVRAATVRVEKLAVFPDVVVGIEITRRRP